MHTKDNNKLKNYIQGLRPFSRKIPKNLKKYLKKSGYNHSSIVDNWTKMVNKKISNICYPEKIKFNKLVKNGTIVLKVLHGKELEVEYQKNEIIDKINSFFGYNCVGKIDLKIIEEKIRLKGADLKKNKDLPKIKKKIEEINNTELKSSLDKFLKAYNEKS